MLQLNISLTTLAIVLWSGMLIISGSIWILASQVRKVADLLDQHGRTIQGTGHAPAPMHLNGARHAALHHRADHALVSPQARLDEIYAAGTN